MATVSGKLALASLALASRPLHGLHGTAPLVPRYAAPFRPRLEAGSCADQASGGLAGRLLRGRLLRRRGLFRRLGLLGGLLRGFRLLRRLALLRRRLLRRLGGL